MGQIRRKLTFDSNASDVNLHAACAIRRKK